MPFVAIINHKGGVGKSTLATQIAGYYASQGHEVVLGDADRQQSVQLWRKLRPQGLGTVGTWDISADAIMRPPSHVSHVVLDTPAGLHGWRLTDVLNMSDKVIVPLQPSTFDMEATRNFMEQLAQYRQLHRLQVGMVGMRVDERTLAAEQLHKFVDGLGFPVLGYLRDTQQYVQMIARGMTFFDLAPRRVARDLEQWSTLCAWLDA
jgi:chromosome partitioning protein